MCFAVADTGYFNSSRTPRVKRLLPYQYLSRFDLLHNGVKLELKINEIIQGVPCPLAVSQAAIVAGRANGHAT